MMDSYKIEYRCSLPHGLHARPATQLEVVCQRFRARIEWCNQRNGRCADAKSVLALLGTDTYMAICVNSGCQVMMPVKRLGSCCIFCVMSCRKR